MNADLAEYFNEIKFGEIKHQGSLAVLPVFTSHDSELHYMTLTDALKADLVEISEMNEMGTVSELKVHNSADVPVLILDGEELVGAKQNRIVNTTILLKKRSLTVIPVSCVEQGRWSYKSRNFQDSSRLAHSKLKNLKSASVKKLNIEFKNCLFLVYIINLIKQVF
jgi:flavodoxin